ncbi:MAG: hypothetical protein IPJ90_14975 [Anaerolineaceae bacterium]|nr:hypothetical protein [Anaerolineaceae bacterium]
MAKKAFWQGYTILFLWIGLGIFLLGLVDPIAEPIVAPLTGLGICILTLYFYKSARSGKLQKVKYLSFLYNEQLDNHTIYFAAALGSTIGLLFNAVRIFINMLSPPAHSDNYLLQAIRQEYLIANYIELIVFSGMALIMIVTTWKLSHLRMPENNNSNLHEETLS